MVWGLHSSVVGRKYYVSRFNLPPVEAWTDQSGLGGNTLANTENQHCSSVMQIMLSLGIQYHRNGLSLC